MSERDLLTSCVHCGFCLEVCPTYQLSGDENNSPRGRLRLWREESEGRLAAVLDATGYAWSLAPQAKDCCGSGGVYHLQRPENSREILEKKSAFLNTAAGDPVILATSNHVCMMQWASAGRSGLVTRPYDVKHVIQLLDPGEQFRVSRGPGRAT